MATCPKCGHVRQNIDNEFVPPTECPKCGVIYEKYTEIQRRLEKERESTELQERSQRQVGQREVKASINEMNGVRRTGTKSKTSGFGIIPVIVGLVIANVIVINNKPKVDNEVKLTLNRNETGKTSIPYAGSYRVIVPNQTQNNYSYEHINTFNNSSAQTKTITSPDIELKNKIDILDKFHEKPLNYSDVFRNDLPQFRWESIRKTNNYALIKSVLNDYRNDHTYTLKHSFVCVDMAIDVWNILATKGIKSKLMIGNIDKDISTERSLMKYLGNMTHAWVLAEVSPSCWIPLETTGGFIVEPSKTNYRHYNKGTIFDNPKQCKDFEDYRKAMFDSIREFIVIQKNYNQLYAGKPITRETTEYIGRMKQKLDDCEDLIEKVTGLL